MNKQDCNISDDADQPHCKAYQMMLAIQNKYTTL